MQEYDGIETHDGHPAINVKVHAHIDLPEMLEPYGEAAWESVTESWWKRATGLAHERGYSGVYSEGRSGGWCVPYYQRLSADERAKRNMRTHPVTGATLMLNSPGQGGGLGYPYYPDVDDIGERSRFRAFARRIEALLDAVPAMIRGEAAFLAECDALARIQ